ncbi:MAG: putative sugar nucleotidyl transferase [Rhodothermales bacterium]|nr:putative sugar nucleotidyl transferase [Rhodothermales bacterium]
MTHLCLFEDARVHHLRPLIDMRAVYQLRPGMFTLLDATRLLLNSFPVVLHSRPDVASIVATATGLSVNRLPVEAPVVFVNGRYLAEAGPVAHLIAALFEPSATEQVLVQGDDVIAARVHRPHPDLLQRPSLELDAFADLQRQPVAGARLISRLWHLIDEVRPALVRDARTCERQPARWDATGLELGTGAILAARERIFIGVGVHISHGAILNATHGPIVLDDESSVLEGAIVRGPVYIGKRATVRARAEVEGSSIGPGCKVGGEVSDVIMHAHANKGHAGFLGHSYIGKWCNLGAGTNVSNLRNDYGEVALYNAYLEAFEPSGRQFLGVFMGDHTKLGIQSMVNTGSVFGVSCNLFGAGYLERHVPSFSWGGPLSGLEPYRIDKALRVAEVMMARRNLHMTADERVRLQALCRIAHSVQA